MSLYLSTRQLLHGAAGPFFALALVLLLGACQAAECAQGLVLVDGQCVEGPPCGGCSEHELCDMSVTPNACACVPGYERQDASCVFAELVRDPGFEQDLDTGPWSDDRGKGAGVLPLESGYLDPGEGALADSVICNAGSLLQAVEMPSYERAEPFVAEVTYMAEGVHGLAVGFNRSWKRLPPATSTWRTEVFCLGEGGYGQSSDGGEVQLRLSASERHENCYEDKPGSSIRIDHITIRPAGEFACPVPRYALNGSADAERGGWRFFTDATGSAEAGFAPRAGREATSGARLAREADQTGRAAMTTKISVPLPATVQSPALRFWWKGTADSLFDVNLGTLVDLDDRGRRGDTLVGTGSPWNYIYCLPPWTHGSVLDLSFSLPDAGSDEVELVVDDIEIISDLDCGNEEGLLDPGFESAPNRWVGASVSSLSDAVLLQPSEPLALSGSTVLELSFKDPGSELAMETYVLVPEPDGDQLPALTFHSLGLLSSSTEVQWVLGRSGVEKAAAETEISFEPNEVCLPPAWAGRWFRVQIKVRSTGDPSSRERVLLDDFSLGTSPCAIP